MATAVLPVTGDRDADELLVTDPFALLVGMLLDQQVPMEWAFRGPLTLRDRLGHLDPHTIAAMSVDDFEAVCREKPAIHRYPGSMGKRTHALAVHVVDTYDGDAAAIWTTAKDPDELFARLRALPGYGDEKAKIFLAILGKRLRRRAEGLGGDRGRRSPMPSRARSPTSTRPRRSSASARSSRRRRRRARARPTDADRRAASRASRASTRRGS